MFKIINSPVNVQAIPELYLIFLADHIKPGIRPQSRDLQCFAPTFDLRRAEDDSQFCCDMYTSTS
jgi:hypothetical protein